MHKILILGAKGMLGQALVEEFSNGYEVVGWDKEDLDISQGQKAIKAIKALKPDFLINAAAYTDVDGAETNQALAMKVNGKAVGYLAKVSRMIDAFFIHISTDYVFEGTKKSGYDEKALAKNPLNLYAKSKLLGEKLLLKEADRGLEYYLIRTSWLFGNAQRFSHHAKRGLSHHAKRGCPAPRGMQAKSNFVDTMLKLAEEHNELRVVNDQHGKPTYAKDLAKMVHYMIESQLESGIYHFTNEPRETWYQFAKLIFNIKKELEPQFKVPKVMPVTSKEFLRPAKRPKFSVLLNTKLPKGRQVKEALRDYLQGK